MVCGPNFWVKSSGGGALRVIAGEPGNHTVSRRARVGRVLYLDLCCFGTVFPSDLYCICTESRGVRGGEYWRNL